MGFAAVTCSRNWTPMCDSIQARVDAATPWLIGAGAVLLGVGLALCIIGEVRAARRAQRTRAGSELRNRLDD